MLKRICQTLGKLAVLTLLIWLAQPLFHSQSVSAQEAHEKITVTVGEWPPFLSQELENGGIIAEMIVDIFASEGIEATLNFLPWGRGYTETAEGNHEAMGVWMHKPEREKDFYYSDPVLIEKFVFFHRKDQPFEWDKLSDLKGMVMGGGIKYSYGSEFDKALEEGQFHMNRAANDEINFKKLLADRVTLYPQEISVGYFALRRNFPKEEQEKITHHTKAILNNLSYVLFPKAREDSLELMARFNKGLKTFRENGLYDIYIQRLTSDETS